MSSEYAYTSVFVSLPSMGKDRGRVVIYIFGVGAPLFVLVIMGMRRPRRTGTNNQCNSRAFFVYLLISFYIAALRELKQHPTLQGESGHIFFCVDYCLSIKLLLSIKTLLIIQLL